MHIGILTFSNAFNLGAALQAFSLQKKLEEMGNSAELIDYRCPAIEEMHKMRPIFRAEVGTKARIYNLIHNIVFFPRRIRYIEFKKYAKRSKVYLPETMKEANDKYDLFITGSDQVFNLKLTGNDTTFFLDFVENSKKVSYAASLGMYQVEHKEAYRKYLSSFDALSLREKSSAEVLESECDLSIEVIPDPVFLHTGEEWKKLLGAKEKKRKKYVLIYALIEDMKLYEIAQKVAKENDMEVVVITKILRPLTKVDHIVRNAGPREFIEWMINADYVVTNSFHGTAFSLIFERQFTILMPPAAPERILDLLKTVGLEKRIYTGVIETESIDYKKTEHNMGFLKQQGERYLEKITDWRKYNSL